MRYLPFAFAGLFFLTVVPAALTSACSSDSGSGSPDASSDGGTDGTGSDVSIDTALPPPPDASMQHCKLDTGGDPVGLCLQKIVLSGEHAMLTKNGIPASWDSTMFSPDTNDAGMTLHDFHDDVGYAASTAIYHQTSTRYGDTELTPALDGDLMGLVPLIQSELATLPNEYSGELYFHLRTIASGLRFLNDNMDATSIDAIADGYGRAIYTQHWNAMPIQPDGGTPDAGGDAGAGDAATDAASSEAGPSDSGLDASDGGCVPAPIADGILGTMSGSGAFVYRPADVATGAFALLDLALRNPADTNTTNWQNAALSALEHIKNRARDPVTGLYYAVLDVSSNPAHDDLDPSQSPPDALLSDVSATVAFMLVRAEDFVNTNAAMFACTTTDYATNRMQPQVDAIVASLNGMPSLWDGPSANGDGGPTDMPGAVMEGYIPSTQTTISNKTMRANVYLLAVLHRTNIYEGNSPYASEINPLRFVMLTLPPPMSDSFLSVVNPPEGVFRAATKGYTIVSEPRGGSYRTSAGVDFVEGLSDLFYGLP